MKKTLLVIENDFKLEEDRHLFVMEFMKRYDGELIVLTNFRNKTKEEIVEAVSKSTDIAVQTSFVSGSDYQLESMIRLMSKVKRPINVYISFNGLKDYLLKYISEEDIISIAHHNIYEMGTNFYDEELTHIKLDFDDIVTKERNRKEHIANYKATAPNRPTGRKVLVLACNAHGTAFKNLPIGKEVDELICDELEESPSGAKRGVWIMGNGEPIKLVNDCGLQEYKIVSKMSIEDLLIEISKTTAFNIDELSRLEMTGLVTVLESTEDSPMDKANFICEEFEIPKRTNRQAIYQLISDNQ